MTESRVLWLALGVFVGFMLWGEARRSASTGRIPPNAGAGVMTADTNTTLPAPSQRSFPPRCGSCGG